MKITEAKLKIILDSRGKETLEAELISGAVSVFASVPSGKSRGKHEIFVLEPPKALEKFEEIKKEILSRDFQSQEEFDEFLISLDGSQNKSNLGGNLILAFSLGFARLKSKIENNEVFEYIAQIANRKSQITKLPHPIFNVINGGAHAKNNLDFQEFQVIPQVEDFGLALGLGQEFYEKLGQLLEKKFGKEKISLGDEAGYSGPFKANEEAIEIMADLITKQGYPLRIGLDAAANQFYKDGKYILEGKELSNDKLNDFYLRLIESYNILSIEDPFNEEDFDSFSVFTDNSSKFKTLVIADDLTTTNSNRLEEAINKKSGNVILIKPNQIGTLTETLRVIELAYKNNWQAIISHRSGETMDDFIADLAVGVNSWGIKAGAPGRPERTVKYDRILKISKNFAQSFQ